MAVETPILFGGALRRREDPRFTTGTGSRADDPRLSGAAYLAILRSPFGHARIVSIDTRRAREPPGVRRVFTGQDCKRRAPARFRRPGSFRT